MFSVNLGDSLCGSLLLLVTIAILECDVKIYEIYAIVTRFVFDFVFFSIICHKRVMNDTFIKFDVD